MLKLMKYELRKTAFSKLVLLVITAVAEIAFLIGVFWSQDPGKWNFHYHGRRIFCSAGSH